VAWFVHTDIARDGTLAGPNLSALGEMVELLGHGVIASGGVGTVDDVGRVAALGADGVVVGRALYDGRVALADALDRARRWQHEW
jgi:phosphoribosylformimino-5-aminoimidazole carboxamide ribotide isomerase